MTKEIVIDAGHGGHDSGAVGNGLREKDLTLSIARKIKDILDREYNGARVTLTRSGDTFLTLAERAKIANDRKADYFCSVHINAHTDPSANGFETFIFNGNVSPATIARQNVVHPAINRHAQLRDRGRKTANFGVLRMSNMPAILTEIGFISNASDAQKLKSEAYLTSVARGHVEGIAQALGGITKKPTPTQTPSNANANSNELFRVQVGAFKDRSNAERFLAEVRRHYKDAYIN